MSSEPRCPFYRCGVCRLFGAVVRCDGAIAICRRPQVLQRAAWWHRAGTWLLIAIGAGTIGVEWLWIPHLVLVLR